MAIFNGSDLIITLAADGGTEQKLLHATSCTYSLNRDTIDISSKDSANGFREILSGQGSFTISADGLMDFTSTGSTTDPDEVFDFMLNRTKVDFTFALSTPAGYTLTGEGFVSSLEITSGVEDAPTYSISIEGTGTPVKTPV